MPASNTCGQLCIFLTWFLGAGKRGKQGGSANRKLRVHHIPSGLSRLSSTLYERSSSSISDLQHLTLILITPSWSLSFPHQISKDKCQLASLVQPLACRQPPAGWGTQQHRAFPNCTRYNTEVAEDLLLALLLGSTDRT